MAQKSGVDDPRDDGLRSNAGHSTRANDCQISSRREWMPNCRITSVGGNWHFEKELVSQRRRYKTTAGDGINRCRWSSRIVYAS